MQSDLHRDSILFCRYIDRIFDQFFPGIIEVFDKFTQTVLRKEHFMPGSIGLRIDLPFIRSTTNESLCSNKPTPATGPIRYRIYTR